MQQRAPKSLSWPEVLAALRSCAAESVFIRDGKETEPAGTVRNRPAARGTALCFFPAEIAAARAGLIEQLDVLAKRPGRLFSGSARASIGGSHLLIRSVADELLDGTLVTIVDTRRPALGFNQSRDVGASSTLRSKRIKNG